MFKSASTLAVTCASVNAWDPFSLQQLGYQGNTPSYKGPTQQWANLSNNAGSFQNDFGGLAAAGMKKTMAGWAQPEKQDAWMQNPWQNDWKKQNAQTSLFGEKLGMKEVFNGNDKLFNQLNKFTGSTFGNVQQGAAAVKAAPQQNNVLGQSPYNNNFNGFDGFGEFAGFGGFGGHGVNGGYGVNAGYRGNVGYGGQGGYGGYGGYANEPYYGDQGYGYANDGYGYGGYGGHGGYGEFNDFAGFGGFDGYPGNGSNYGGLNNAILIGW